MRPQRIRRIDPGSRPSRSSPGLFLAHRGKRFLIGMCCAGLLLIGGLPAVQGWAQEGGAPTEIGAAPEAKGREAVTYDARGQRDPFIPLVKDGRIMGVLRGRQVETSRPVLYGILWDPGGQSIALINDGEVKVGDTVEGYRVKEIREDAVVLTQEGTQPIVLQIAFDALETSERQPRNRRGRP